jgi:ABC-type polysaccharide/polyol phosphate export permease
MERRIRLDVKRSWLGVVFPVLSPFVLLALYVFVFHQVFKVPIPDYWIYLFSGLLPWSYLSQTLPNALTSLSFDAELIKRSAFRYELLPIATVTAAGLYFCLTTTIFVVALALLGHLDYVLLPALVVPMLCLYLLMDTLAVALSLIDVYNRDLRRLLGNLLTVWFFLIPIVYGQSQAHALSFLRYIDPANLLVSEFRSILYYRQFPAVHTFVSGAAICAGILALTLAVFHRFSDRLPREL